MVKSSLDPPADVSVLRDVRVGAHPEQGGWDRIVFEFAGSSPAAEVRYGVAPVGCGSGAPIAVAGSAVLTVKMVPAQAHDDAGRLTIRSTTIQGPGAMLVEAKQTCDFEADVTWAIGLRAQQRFFVTLLRNPSRLVIDIKQ
jgi:hypothetical protein